MVEGADRRRRRSTAASTSWPASSSSGWRRDGAAARRDPRSSGCSTVGTWARATSCASRSARRVRRRETLRAFHAAHAAEYGHASDDPIEIVNLRVTVRGRAPAAEPRRRSRSGERSVGAHRRAPIASGASTARSTSCPRRRLLRERLPLDEPVAGPGHRLPARHDDRRAAGMGGHRDRRRRRCSCGHRQDGDQPDITARPDPAEPRRPDHRRRDRRRADARSRSRWATAWPACRTPRSSASPRTSAARSATTRAASCASPPSRRRCSRGRSPATWPGSTAASPRSGDEWQPGDVVVHNHPYYGASHQPDVGFAVPVFLGDELVGFSVTTAHHLDLGALTPGTLRHRRRDGRVRRGPAAQRGQGRGGGTAGGQRVADHRRQHPDARSSWSATWRPRWPPPSSAPSACWSSSSSYGLETVRAASEQLMDQSERMLRRRSRRSPTARYEARARSTASSTTPTRPTGT